MTHRKRKAPRIKWSLFASFTALTVICLILLWILQLLFLNTIYEWTTRAQMRRLAEEMEDRAHAEDFLETAEVMAESAHTAMAIYRVDGESITPVMQSHEKDGVLQVLDSADVQTLYRKATEGEVFQAELSDALPHGKFTLAQKSERLLSVMVISASDGNRYLMILDTGILPLRAFFHLTQNQLFLVSVVLLSVSAGGAFLLARHIASPIERISRKAVKISKGDYRLDFSERSYYEVEELSSVLNRAADELSKTDRMQKELIANISHDLRTPLTTIVGYAEMMRDIEGENTPENMQVIIDEATRLSSLVNDVLEISRIQGGTSTLKRERFDLSALTNETLARYRHLNENNGFIFLLKSESDVWVEADKMKITQVLCNLLNNAVNYSLTDKRIQIRIFKNEGSVRLEVEDHGVGISAENLSNVWQRYYRDESNHRRSISGSGLGLSIVREILDLHDARYGVSSQLGKGSVFWFELPPAYEELFPEKV